ncbi:hypothetical protein HK405_009322 [Cladochytrium tenue]|nr:hypothetical protein HK405_009322 [Cladochytrium tenue]
MPQRNASYESVSKYGHSGRRTEASIRTKTAAEAAVETEESAAGPTRAAKEPERTVPTGAAQAVEQVGEISFYSLLAFGTDMIASSSREPDDGCVRACMPSSDFSAQ